MKSYGEKIGNKEPDLTTLRGRRVASKLSLRAAADRAAMDVVRYGEIERGVREPPTPNELKRVEGAVRRYSLYVTLNLGEMIVRARSPKEAALELSQFIETVVGEQIADMDWSKVEEVK